MILYNTFKIKVSYSQLNQLKWGIKNGHNVTATWSYVTGNSNDETNFPHKLLLTNKQVSSLWKAVANNLAANIQLSKSQ